MVSSAVIPAPEVRPLLRRVGEFDWSWVLVSLVLVFVFVIRFLNIRDLAFPAWVDSVHHSAIARLIVQEGVLPVSYRPFADVDTVYYHLGYHVVIAIITALGGWPLERVMLVFGQILNALASAALCVLAYRWTGKVAGGLAALVVSGTLSLMPAYYVTWGRYTQLLGLVILPITMLFVTDALNSGRRRLIIPGGLLTGALFYVHYRVTFFLGMYVLAYLLCHSVLSIRRKEALKLLGQRVVAVGIIATVVSLPWLWRLMTTFVFPLDSFLTRISGNREYNAVPWDLVGRDFTPALYLAAGFGVILGLRARRLQVVVTLVWCLITIFTVNPNLIGIKPTWIVNNFSVVISQFVPLSLLAAFAVAELMSLVEQSVRISVARWANLAITLALVVIAFVGGVNLINIVNPVTVLATAEDARALEWIRANTPVTALFLVNARLWQGNDYVGTDGGYWIPNITSRRTTMPIVFYTEGDPAYVEQVNSLARVIESGPNPNDSSFLTLLRGRGVTNVYIGVKGGPLPLNSFLHSPNYTLLYSAGGAYVFRLNPPT